MSDVAADASLIVALTGLLGALCGLIGALWQGARTRDELGRARRDITATKHEVSPNHGSSLRDAIDRIENRIERLWAADARRAADADRVHREIFHRLGRLERGSGSDPSDRDSGA